MQKHKLYVQALIHKKIPSLKENAVIAPSQKLGMYFIIYVTVHFFADQRRTYLSKHCQKQITAHKFRSIMNATAKITNLAKLGKIILDYVRMF